MCLPGSIFIFVVFCLFLYILDIGFTVNLRTRITIDVPRPVIFFLVPQLPNGADPITILFGCAFICLTRIEPSRRGYATSMSYHAVVCTYNNSACTPSTSCKQHRFVNNACLAASLPSSFCVPLCACSRHSARPRFSLYWYIILFVCSRCLSLPSLPFFVWHATRTT
jgi:hypothetical protein